LLPFWLSAWLPCLRNKMGAPNLTPWNKYQTTAQVKMLCYPCKLLHELTTTTAAAKSFNPKQVGRLDRKRLNPKNLDKLIMVLAQVKTRRKKHFIIHSCRNAQHYMLHKFVNGPPHLNWTLRQLSFLELITNKINSLLCLYARP
jgi:hypothetical protein